MVYQIWSATDKFFCDFEPFFALSAPLTTQKIKILKLKKTSYAPRYGVQQTGFFVHSGLFFAILPPYGPRTSKFLKNEKTPQDIIILHMCTINDNHMMHGS